MARKLDPLENLFPQPSTWGRDSNITAVTQGISSLVSVTDPANNVHVLWVQSPALSKDRINAQIEYSRWDGQEWTKPLPVFTNLSELPLNLTLQMDHQQRLLLSWVNQSTGQLMFSWANSERADISGEWIPPVVVSSSSQLNNSPDMLVDASDRIVIAYAVTLNEERGIYVVQSADRGATWSTPLRAFDAVSANWEMIDQPKLTVSEDGALHILFTQYTLLGGQRAVGLYYSQSRDGGVTWSAAEMVNQHAVEWSDIAVFKQTLHRFWSENDQSVILTYHQVSSDGGLTWSPPTVLRGNPGIASKPAVSLDGSGNVHLLLLVWEDGYFLQEWDWTGENSQLVESRKLGILPEPSPMTIESGITANGNIYALIQYEKLLPSNEVETRILNLSRALELTEPAQPFLASVSTPSTTSIHTPVAEVQSTPILDVPLVPVDNTQSQTVKNIVGFILIVSIVLVILYLTIPNRKKSTAKFRQSNHD
jgi:hypothetical protein